MEFDLARFRGLTNADRFVATLEQACELAMTTTSGHCPAQRSRNFVSAKPIIVRLQCRAGVTRRARTLLKAQSC
jgi:hypothetical protein